MPKTPFFKQNLARSPGHDAEGSRAVPSGQQWGWWALPLDSPNHCDGPCIGVPEAKGGSHQGPDSSSLQGSAPAQFQRPSCILLFRPLCKPGVLNPHCTSELPRAVKIQMPGSTFQDQFSWSRSENQASVFFFFLNPGDSDGQPWLRTTSLNQSYFKRSYGPAAPPGCE